LIREWPLADERALMADGAYRSFWYFLKYACGISLNPEGWWLDPIEHRKFVDVLEDEGLRWLADRHRKNADRARFGAILFRTFGKTVILTKCFPLWLSLRDPELAIVIDSETAEKAAEFLSSTRAIMGGGDPYALFVWLFGNWKSAERKWTTKALVHAARRSTAKSDPSFGTWGVNTGGTGKHPDVLVIDDPISRERLREDANWIKIVNQHINSAMKALKPNGFLLLVATPYDEDDPTQRLPRLQGVDVCHGMPEILDARIAVGDGGLWTLYVMAARRRDGECEGRGSPVLPNVWSDAALLADEQDNPIEHAAQMMLQPGTSLHNPITSNLVESMKISRNEVSAESRITLHLDTAFRYKDRLAAGDWSVIETWAHDPAGTGIVTFLGARTSRDWKADEFCEELIEVILEVRRQGFVIRAMTDERPIGGHGGVWEAFLRSKFVERQVIMPPFVQILRHIHGKKKTRIQDALSHWRGGFVRLVVDAPFVQELIRQALRGENARPRDMLDAACDVFHPDIYHGMRSEGRGGGIEPLLATDRVLDPGRVTDEEAVKLYDEIVRKELEEKEGSPWAREPIR
jgi:hypothetical protein